MRKPPKSVTESLWWASAAIHTLHASTLTLWLARVFGRRYTGEDGDHKIVGYEWRGVLYVTDYIRSRNGNTPRTFTGEHRANLMGTRWGHEPQKPA